MSSTSPSFIAQKLDGISFDGLLAAYDPFSTGNCRFDLSTVSFVSPTGLVQLAAACHALAHGGGHPEIVFKDTQVSTYLDRAGFFTATEGVATIQTPIRRDPGHSLERLRGRNPLLIEVTKIESGSALPALLDRLVSVLHVRLKYRKYDAYDAVTAVSEICQNTFDHNQGTLGFLAMQVYGKGARRRLEIGVADHGVGIRTTLSRNPKNGTITSDQEAVRRATILGTSEHDDPTRGTGLYHLLDIAYRNQGVVQIRSGAAKARFRMDQRRGWVFGVTTMPGVQIELQLGAKG